MIILVAIIAYILGSIPSGYIIGKTFFETDIRDLGSGNIGSTNALRNFGKRAGMATFILDILKGFLAVLIGNKLDGYNGMSIAFLFVVLGHMYSLFLHFKGGKGVATSFGALLYIDYKFALILIGIFALVVLMSHIVSLGSLVATLAAAIGGYIKFGNAYVFWVLLIITVLIFYSHRSNIKRLVNKEEAKIF
ncbi:glycerol-3-phosphate 1-O-acyltransferase PlsY [Anaerococcus nagyae]|uniref:glycerol-3-phosphate 1-O-acyltransferase PlsY n=1 Tax=Anaerococcus nagyae TaxID=1755241 RepID=UPI003736A83B